MKLPAKEQVSFFLADEIREEQGKKLTILGFAPGPSLFIPRLKDEGNLMLLSLFPVFYFREGEGPYKSKFGVRGPDGRDVVAPKIDVIEKTAGEPALIALRLSPLTAKIGEYTAYLELEGEEFQGKFEFKYAK